MGEVDAGGRRILTAGSWAANSTPPLSIKGGQSMHFAVTNINILGVQLTIKTQYDQEKSLTILPGVTGDYVFETFGDLPINWTFTPSIDSDAGVVTWKLFSTWLPGDAPFGPMGLAKC